MITHQNAIDISKTEQYIISIRLQSDGYSFYIYNPLQQGSYYYYSDTLDLTLPYLQQLSEAIFEQPWLTQSYQSVYIMDDRANFTTVPISLYDSAQATDYYSYCYPTLSNEQVICNVLPRAQIALLFGIDGELFNFAQRTFISPKFVHPHSALCEYFITQSKRGNSNKCFACITHGRVLIECFDNRGATYLHSYSFSSPNDAAFYILNAWHNLGMSQTNDEFYLTGDVQQCKNIEALIKKYIIHLLPIIAPSALYCSGDTLRKIAFDQIILPTCEL